MEIPKMVFPLFENAIIYLSSQNVLMKFIMLKIWTCFFFSTEILLRTIIPGDLLFLHKFCKLYFVKDSNVLFNALLHTHLNNLWLVPFSFWESLKASQMSTINFIAKFLFPIGPLSKSTLEISHLFELKTMRSFFSIIKHSTQ